MTPKVLLFLSFTLAGCRQDCRIQKLERWSPDGSIVARVFENGDCGGGLNTVVNWVELAKADGSAKAGDRIFAIVRGVSIHLTWLQNRDLMIAYTIWSEDANTIDLQTDGWAPEPIWGNGSSNVGIHYRRTIDPAISTKKH